METPTKDDLLRELDRLDYRDRMARAARLGKDGAGSPELELLLDRLEQGDVYEQRLALAICRTAGDGNRILRALNRSSVAIRRQAARLASYLATDEDALCAAVLEAPEGVRIELLRGIGRARRTALADRLMPAVLHEYGARSAATLLAGCSGDAIQRLLPSVSHEVRGWRRLAARHPDVVLDHVGHALAAASRRQRPRVWSELGAAFDVLCLIRAREVVDLLLDLPVDDGLLHSMGSSLGHGALACAGCPFEL